MPCRLYNNNGFGCGGCKHFVRTTSVTLAAGVLTLAIPSIGNIQNGEKVCICIAQAIPDTVTSADTVSITVGTDATAYPLRTKCGNNVHADQVRSRKVLHTYAATDIPQFVVSGCDLCKTGFNFPVIAAAVVSGGGTA